MVWFPGLDYFRFLPFEKPEEFFLRRLGRQNRLRGFWPGVMSRYVMRGSVMGRSVVWRDMTHRLRMHRDVVRRLWTQLLRAQVIYPGLLRLLGSLGGLVIA